MLGIDLFNLFGNGMDDARMERNVQLFDGIRRWIAEPKSTTDAESTISQRHDESGSITEPGPARTVVRKADSAPICVIPDDETETLRQFVLDAPRMDVTIDGQPWTGNNQPDQLLSLFFRLLPRWSAVLAAEFCTQTALAPFFCSVRETLEQDTHFVDGGRQTVRLESQELQMHVEKPFKIVDFDDQMNARTLFVVTLILQVDLRTGQVEHHFCRSSLVEKDWVYVEELSMEDETAFANGAGAQDIAASAMRMKTGT